MKLFLKKYRYAPLLALVLIVMPVSAHAEVGFIEGAMWKLVVQFFGGFVGILGMMLDYALSEFIIKFGTNYKYSGVGAVVNSLWVNVRDIFNMTFIFGLVYIGFKMILNSDDSNTKKWLVNLIMAALLVNFSLFFTKAIIDVSNIVATEVAAEGFDLDSDGFPSISITFMNKTGVSSILSAEELDEKVAGDGVWGYIFGSAILFIVTMFVFAAGAFMITIRYAVLLIYMMLSPFMFIGWVFPQLQKYTDQYWSGFLGKAFFAPIYILMVYLSLQVIGKFYSDAVQQSGPGSIGGVLGADGSATAANFGSTIPPFILASIMMLAAVIISNKIGADGAGAAMKIGGNITNRARRGTQNMAKWTGRKAASTAAYVPARAARMGTAAVGRNLEKGLTAMQKQRGGLSGGVGAVLRTKSVNQTLRKGTGAVKDAKFGTGQTQAQASQESRENKKNFENLDILHKANEAKRINELISAAAEAKTIPKPTKGNEIYDPKTKTIVPIDSFGDDTEGLKAASEAAIKRNEVIEEEAQLSKDGYIYSNKAENERKTALEEAEKYAAKMSVRELETMQETDPTSFKTAASFATDGVFEKLKDSDKIPDDVKAEMTTERQAAIRSTMEENGQILSENLQNMSIKQIETMGSEFIADNAHLFSKKQMDDIMKSSSFTGSQRGNFASNRSTKQKDIANDATQAAQLFNHNTKANPGSYDKPRKVSEIAALPLDVYIKTDPVTGAPVPNIHNLQKINKGILMQIAKDNTLDGNQRDELAREVMRLTPGSGPNDPIVQAQNYLMSAEGAKNYA